jgi:hypothetical protein
MSLALRPLVLRPLAFGLLAAALVAAAAGRPVLAQDHHPGSPAPAEDSSFAALQARGKIGMGVDQYAARHRFDDLPDGGRIELQVSPADTAGVRTVREHLRGIARAFAAGDFRTPGFVHAGEVPGTAVMAAKRANLEYRFGPLPGGGEVRIRTEDPEARKAVHAFLGFQRQEHHAPGASLHHRAP